MIADLSMYDRAETAEANDALWSGLSAHLRAAGIAAPERLTRGRDLWEVWLDPGLVLAQTCGLPFRMRLHGRVDLVATPDYGLEGCAPGHYCSVIVVREGDPRATLADFADGLLAINQEHSQSGWAAPHAAALAAGFAPRRVIMTGAHRASAEAVARGAADWAAIDALTWRMIARWDGAADGLRVLGTTAPTPALPYITAKGGPVAALRAALGTALADLAPEMRDILGLHGIVTVPASDYLALPLPPPPPGPDNPAG
jgi:ABC-type phosphate/phosphonate transport system substrate-binding protein